jgi:hypothetical protein
VAPPERPPLLQPLPMSQEGGVSVGSLDVPAPRFGQPRSWSRVRNKEDGQCRPGWPEFRESETRDSVPKRLRAMTRSAEVVVYFPRMRSS